MSSSNPIPLRRFLALVIPLLAFAPALMADVQQTNVPSISASSAAESKPPVLWTLSIGCGDSIMANSGEAHFEMKGFVAQAALRRGRGRSWLELLADYYSSPDPRWRPEATAIGLHGSWGWNLMNTKSTALYAKAGVGLSWLSKKYDTRIVREKVFLCGIGSGVDQLFYRGWGLRLEGRIEISLLYLNRTGHVPPSWFVVSLGLIKRF